MKALKLLTALSFLAALLAPIVLSAPSAQAAPATRPVAAPASTVECARMSPLVGTALYTRIKTNQCVTFMRDSDGAALTFRFDSVQSLGQSAYVLNATAVVTTQRSYQLTLTKNGIVYDVTVPISIDGVETSIFVSLDPVKLELTVWIPEGFSWV